MPRYEFISSAACRYARVCSTASDVRYRDKLIVLTLVVVSQLAHRHRHFAGGSCGKAANAAVLRDQALSRPRLPRSAHRPGRSVAWPRPQEVSPSRRQVAHCGHRARTLALALLLGGVSGVGGERLGRVVRSRRAKRGALPTAMDRPG